MKDGREIPGQTGYYGPGGQMGLSCNFPALAATDQVDYLRLTFYRAGDADQTVPFVLENVPLPPLTP
jgi:hypothetical protein